MTANKEHVNSKQKRWLTAGFVLFSTLIMLGILGQLFPYTGLAAIILFPVIIILNALVVLATVFVTRHLKKPLYIGTWTICFILTMHFVLAMFPQEFRPSVYKQIRYSILAIRHFEDIPVEELEFPTTIIGFSRYDSQIEDAQERYIVALYKYRESIPLDGSFNLCDQVIAYGTESSIKSIGEIQFKLEGHNKIIWQTLKMLGK